MGAVRHCNQRTPIPFSWQPLGVKSAARVPKRQTAKTGRGNEREMLCSAQNKRKGDGSMHSRVAPLAVVFVLRLLATPVFSQQQQKGGEDLTGPYDVVEKWPQSFARPGYIWGSQGGVF